MLSQDDIQGLAEKERELLNDSFHPQKLQRRVRGIVWSAVAVLIAMVAFAEFGLSVPWFAAVAAAILIISAIEKATYHHTMQAYESLIMKLTHRIEQLEHAQLTPENANPVPDAPSSRHPSVRATG